MNITQKTVNTLRMLSVDAVQQANSGHPGLPLGAAPAAYALFQHHMNFAPKDSRWINRDRFVLSAGHGSALLYSLLHLYGYDLSIEDLKSFRQLHSKTPGHPEYGHTQGVECTTGPLGAGISMAVGMALAERALGAKYNRDGYPVVDHYTYVICGDGDLMEGISNEASSFAGTQKLNKLIVLYDSNQITIEGDTGIAFSEDVQARYQALGWKTLDVADGNDVTAICEAIEIAKTHDAPTLIEVHTKIGFGSPREGLAKAHGEPLGDDLEPTRKALEMGDAFTVDEEVYAHAREGLEAKAKVYDTWKKMYEGYWAQYPELAEAFEADLKETGVTLDLTVDKETTKDQATRAAGGSILNDIAKKVTNLVGGSADLGPSNKSELKSEERMSPKTPAGRNIGFGVREHAMGAIVNGLALHGGFRSYAATFLVFSDYMKPQVRLSALMGLPVTYIFTHDSIGVGEDGPTHQPIEQLTMLRSIPNLVTFRPADTTETAAGWEVAMHSTSTPTALILSRQTLPELAGSSKDAKRGGYILKEEKEHLDMILLASGSEVSLAIEAANVLEEEGVGVRVVSMPSMELFEAQCASYREKVLPKQTKRLAIEAAATMPWYRYVGTEGRVIGIDAFGASGSAKEVFKAFDMTTDHLLREARELLQLG